MAKPERTGAIDPARAMLSEFTKVARLALFASIALSVALLTVSLLTAASTNGPRCAGRLIAGAFGFHDCIGLAVVCGLILWFIGKFASGRDERLKKLFKTLESPSGDIDPFVGRTIANATLAGCVAMLVIIAGFLTINSFYPVLSLCLPSWWAGD